MFITGQIFIALLLSTIINTFAAFMLKPQGIRVAGLIGSIPYLLFNVFLGIYSGAILKAIMFIMTLSSYIVWHRKVLTEVNTNEHC